MIEQAPLLEYVSQYAEFSERNGEMWACSPLSQKDTDPSFSIDPEQNVYFDYSSGSSGNILNFIMAKDKCDFRKAIQTLKDWLGVTEDVEYCPLPIVKTLRAYKPKRVGKEKTAHTVIPLSELRRYETDDFPYWKDEGITLESIRKWNIGVHNYKECITIPIWDADGHLINFLCRTINPLAREIGIPKYIYRKKLGVLDFFWGWAQNLENIRRRNEVLIVEGCKSVIKLDQWGYDNTVALLTSHLGDDQLKLLIKCGFDVVFLLDKDQNPRNDPNVQKLKRFCRTYVCLDRWGLLDEKDAPCDRGREVFEKILEGRRRLK